MESSNNTVPDYPPVSKNGIGSSFPSRKTVTVFVFCFYIIHRYHNLRCFPFFIIRSIRTIPLNYPAIRRKIFQECSFVYYGSHIQHV